MASDTLWVRVVVDGLHGLRKLELNVIAVNQALSLMSALFNRLTAVPLSILETTDAFRKLTVMLTHTEGSAEAAAARIDKLRAMVQKVGVPLQDLAKVAAQFQAAGLQDVDRTIKALADAVAAFGGGRQDFELAALSIQQMAGKGVVSMEELRRQLGERIPTAIRIMARELGISVEELYKQVKSGQLEAFGAIAAMIRGFEADYGGTTERLTNTWERAMLDMKDAWQQFARAVGESGFADDVMSDIRGLATLMRAITPGVVPPAVRRVELLEQQRESLEEQLKTTGLKPGGIASFRGIFDRLINANLNIEDVEKELADVNKQLQYTKAEVHQYYEAWEDHNIDLTKLAKKDIGVDVQKAIDAFNAKHPLKSLLAYAIELDAAFQKEQESGLSEMNRLAQRQADTMNERMRAAEREGMEYETLRDRLEPLRAKALHEAERVAFTINLMMEDIEQALPSAPYKKGAPPGAAAPVAGRRGPLPLGIFDIRTPFGGMAEGMNKMFRQAMFGLSGSILGAQGGVSSGVLGAIGQGAGFLGSLGLGATGGGLGMAAQLIWAAMMENPKLKAVMDKVFAVLVEVVEPLAVAIVPVLEALVPLLQALKPVFELIGNNIKSISVLLIPIINAITRLIRALDPSGGSAGGFGGAGGPYQNPAIPRGEEAIPGTETGPRSAQEIVDAIHEAVRIQAARGGQSGVADLIGFLRRTRSNLNNGVYPADWYAPIDAALRAYGYQQGGLVTSQRMLGYNPITGGGLIYAHEGERVVPRSGSAAGDTFNITLVNPDTNELARQIEYLVRTRRLAL